MGAMLPDEALDKDDGAEMDDHRHNSPSTAAMTHNL